MWLPDDGCAVGDAEEGAGTGWEGGRGRRTWSSLQERTLPCLQSVLFKEHGQAVAWLLSAHSRVHMWGMHLVEPELSEHVLSS